MSTPEATPRPEGPETGPYGGYGGALQHYGGHGPGASVPGPEAPWSATPPYATPASGAWPSAAPGPEPLQRPAVIGTASTLAVTASLLFGCAVALLWMVAYTITASFDPTRPDESVVFHLAERFQLRLTSGLAVPLFGFPLAGAVAGFLVVGQRSLTRLVFSVTGVLALVWSAWWLRHGLGWWAPAAVYIGTAVGIVWTSASTRWYAAGDERAQALRRAIRPTDARV